MAITSLTSRAAGQTQSTSNSSRLQSSVASMLAGKRMSQAYQDILSLSSSAVQSATQRQAVAGIAQTRTGLQVADGAIGQMQSMLARMSYLASSANSGAFNLNTRQMMNTEFQNLAKEMDRIANTTSLNGGSLFDRLVSGDRPGYTPSTTISAAPASTTSAAPGMVAPPSASVIASPAAPPAPVAPTAPVAPVAPVSTSAGLAQKGKASLNFNSNIHDGETFFLNGAKFTAGKDFAVGSTIQESIDNMARGLNQTTDLKLSGASYSRSGNSLVITAGAAGEAGNQYTISEGYIDGLGQMETNYTVTGRGRTDGTHDFTLQGGSDVGGLHSNTIIGTSTGTNNDDLIVDQNQTHSTSFYTFREGTNMKVNSVLQISDGFSIERQGYLNFKFVEGTPQKPTEIKIGSTLEESIQNAADVMNNFTGDRDYAIRGMKFIADGRTLRVEGKGVGVTRDWRNGGTLGAGVSGSLPNIENIGLLTMGNGKNTGIDASNVTNASFTGVIQGFSAEYNGAGGVKASVTVGNETYTANITDTSPTAINTVRFKSQSGNGGYFDVQFAGGKGLAVSDQATADKFAERINAAFSDVTFGPEGGATSAQPQPAPASPATPPVVSAPATTAEPAPVVTQAAATPQASAPDNQPTNSLFGSAIPSLLKGSGNVMNTLRDVSYMLGVTRSQLGSEMNALDHLEASLPPPPSFTGNNNNSAANAASSIQDQMKIALAAQTKKLNPSLLRLLTK